MTDRLEIATRIACALIEKNPPIRIEWNGNNLSVTGSSHSGAHATLAGVATAIADALIEAEESTRA